MLNGGCTEEFFGYLAASCGIEEVNYNFEGLRVNRMRGVRVLTS
jgi:hypothetical protein